MKWATLQPPSAWKCLIVSFGRWTIDRVSPMTFKDWNNNWNIPPEMEVAPHYNLLTLLTSHQPDSRFSRILEIFLSFLLLVVDLEPFQFHFWFSQNNSVEKSRFSRIFTSRSWSLSIWFHFSLLEKEWEHFYLRYVLKSWKSLNSLYKYGSDLRNHQKCPQKLCTQSRFAQFFNRYGIFWIIPGESSFPDGSENAWQRWVESL